MERSTRTAPCTRSLAQLLVLPREQIVRRLPAACAASDSPSSLAVRVEFTARRRRGSGSNVVVMEELEEQVRQRDAQIADLQRLNSEKDARISELLSQLDKYKSVLLFAGAPGGVFVAPTAVPISRKQQRAWGISAEPPSSHSSRSAGNTQSDAQSCQKFYKDQGSVYIMRCLFQTSFGWKPPPPKNFPKRLPKCVL